MDKRAKKRWNREHGPRTPKPQQVQLVYSPKSAEERQRIADRCKALEGTPFVVLPNQPDPKTILFTATDGTPVSAEAVQMVFNDSLLCDAISAWGEDGPLYKDTIGPLEREVYAYALNAYAGVEIPEAYRRPAQ